MNRALRRGAPVALALASALVLVGCSGSSEPSETTDAAAAECLDVPSGDASDSVTVDGEIGGEVTVELDGALAVEETERTVVQDGDGDVPTADASAIAVLSLFNGADGSPLAAGQQLPVPSEETQPYIEGIEKAVNCLPVGTRAVTVAAPADLWGDTGNEAIGVEAGATIVIVADVIEAPEPEALPEPGEWTENTPTIEFHDQATAPTLTLNGEPQADFLRYVVTEGDGEEVVQGDTVSVMYYGVDAATGEMFDNNYGSDPISFGTGDVVQGFGGGLVGMKVGSQFVVTMPPSLGYGEAGESSSDLAGKTLVFAIEIVDTTHAE
ncbi:FKBP-type peptidyl-prolyl cis-trans isomerase [Agromyces seonyuensis]|uniref:peptidylprolyl isomerase n=1 Tax=Agromyces seonyuensis TaxID=2662446 RepID=A0A6I4P377_9MICO|nr:FKBP-type peptidyl-prolyl cis-trans isomerase [Agromyces seonyuensis]MWB98619.1 hypothetical protein [Agromyces seonyuensis]